MRIASTAKVTLCRSKFSSIYIRHVSILYIIHPLALAVYGERFLPPGLSTIIHQIFNNILAIPSEIQFMLNWTLLVARSCRRRVLVDSESRHAKYSKHFPLAGEHDNAHDHMQRNVTQSRV